jgi:hypothetical protein
MAKKDKLSLVGYFFGGRKFKPFKVNKLITLIVGVSFAITSAVTFLSIKELKVTVHNYNKTEVSGKTIYTAAVTLENEYDDNLVVQLFNGENLITVFTLPRKDIKVVDIEFETEGRANLQARALRGRLEEWVKIPLKD